MKVFETTTQKNKVSIKLTENQAELLLSLLKQSNTTDNIDWDIQMDLIIAEIERKLDF